MVMAAGCATAPAQDPAAVARALASGTWAMTQGATAPDGWVRWKVRRDKKETAYSVVLDEVPQWEGDTRVQAVLKAVADGSASGLRRDLPIDLAQGSVLRWQWKVSELIADADNTRRDLEDAPVRVMLIFEGDRAKLPLRERIVADQVRLLTGNELPYATLMYIWENRQPEGTVIDNAYTSRVKMVVAQTGREGVGRWQWRERDVVEDFRRAFGEMPGRVLGVSVMTDSDNTGAHVTAYYGEFQFVAPRQQLAQ